MFLKAKQEFFFVAMQDWKDVQRVAEFLQNKTFFTVKGVALKKPVSRMDVYRHRTYGRFVLERLITRGQQAQTLFYMWFHEGLIVVPRAGQAKMACERAKLQLLQ